MGLRCFGACSTTRPAESNYNKLMKTTKSNEKIRDASPVREEKRAHWGITAVLFLFGETCDDNEVYVIPPGVLTANDYKVFKFWTTLDNVTDEKARYKKIPVELESSGEKCYDLLFGKTIDLMTLEEMKQQEDPVWHQFVNKTECIAIAGDTEIFKISVFD